MEHSLTPCRRHGCGCRRESNARRRRRIAGGGRMRYSAVSARRSARPALRRGGGASALAEEPLELGARPVDRGRVRGSVGRGARLEVIAEVGARLVAALPRRWARGSAWRRSYRTPRTCGTRAARRGTAGIHRAGAAAGSSRQRGAAFPADQIVGHEAKRTTTELTALLGGCVRSRRKSSSTRRCATAGGGARSERGDPARRCGRRLRPPRGPCR